jgi:hypothetical protein
VEIARRIELPTRAVLIEQFDALPFSKYFVCREDVSLSGPIHTVRCRRFGLLCERLIVMAHGLGAYEEIEHATIGDENSAGFRMVRDLFSSRLDSVREAMKRIVVTDYPPTLDERKQLADVAANPT